MDKVNLGDSIRDLIRDSSYNSIGESAENSPVYHRIWNSIYYPFDFTNSYVNKVNLGDSVYNCDIRNSLSSAWEPIETPIRHSVWLLIRLYFEDHFISNKKKAVTIRRAALTNLKQPAALDNNKLQPYIKSIEGHHEFRRD